MASFSFNLAQIGSSLTAPLVIVMPVYNEEANIAAVIGTWSEALSVLDIPFQFVAVNDGSRDRSQEILLQLESANPHLIRVVSKANGGHGSTCRIGYNIAVDSTADWVLQIDSDGQCDPTYFPEFWRRRGEADCVFGVRTVRDDGQIRKLISSACRFLTALATGRDLKDANVPYRLMKREALGRALERIPADFDLQNIALTLALKRQPGLRWVYLPIRFRARQGGSNSVHFLKIARMGWAMLRQIHRIGKPTQSRS
ncbi:MAG: glycosyltransferase family 2 protein [Chthoniobacterales bacterium]